MSYGALSHIAISAQESFGTATNSWEFVPIISESLTTDIEQLVEEGMRARFESGDTHEGLMTVAGDIVFEPHPILLGHFLRGVTGQSSGTLVDSVYTHEYVPTQTDFTAGICALPPYTIQMHRDTTNSWQFTDTQINQLAIDIEGGTIVKATASVLSRVSSLMTKASPSYPAGDPWVWDAASISMAGSADGLLESFSVVINNNVEGVTVLNGDRFHGKYLRSAPRETTFSGNMCFANETEYGKFRIGTEQAMLVTLTGASITSSQSNKLALDTPQAKYSTFPVNVGDAGRISVGFEGVCKFNTTSSYAIRPTLINTRASYKP